MEDSSTANQNKSLWHLPPSVIADLADTDSTLR